MHSIFIFTEHAVQQFITRFDRTFTYEEGKLLLETVALDEPIKAMSVRTHSGEMQWHVPTLKAVFITKPRKEGNIVVTIIQEDHCTGLCETHTDISSQKTILESLAKLDTITPKAPR